jgi:L-lactate utilization protein LutB
MLAGIRSALGRRAGQRPSDLPPARLNFPRIPAPDLIELFRVTLEKLGGKVYVTSSPDGVLPIVDSLMTGKRAVASNSGVLRGLGITRHPTVIAGVTDKARLRALCSEMDVGITSADYALADTGTLVMLSSGEEARMISLLPPVHIAVVPAQRMLTSLDELLTVLPLPAEETSSMVLITGTSRTADIEQILVRGVHGPGEVHVIIT